MKTDLTSGTGATALVTGASMGIGLELARVLASHGHNLILVARHRDTLEAVAGNLEGKHGIKAAVIPADLSIADAPAQLYDSVTADGLKVDFLINNAGFGLGGAFSDTDLDRELEMIQVNIAALTALTKLFLGPMLSRRSGRIMNVASTAAFQPGPLMSVYYASKAYVLSFSEAVAEEIRDSGVTMTVFCPGPTATNFARAALMENSRLFNMAHIARADEAARYAYDAMMRGRRVAVPGFQNKLIQQSNRLAPRRLVTMLSRIVQEKR